MFLFNLTFICLQCDSKTLSTFVVNGSVNFEDLIISILTDPLKFFSTFKKAY